MADKDQQEYIVLYDPIVVTENQSGRLVLAPAGFDWMSYPELVEIDGRKWRYVGTMDAVPYYRPA